MALSGDQYPPGLPGANPANPFAGNHADPEAMLAYANEMAAAARYMQRTAARQYQPQAGAQMQSALPMQAAEPPPQPPASEQQKPRASRRSPVAEEHGGASLWTYFIVIALSFAAGFTCGHDWRAPDQSQQLSR